MNDASRYDLSCNCKLSGTSFGAIDEADDPYYACCHTRLIAEIIEADGFDKLPRHLNKKVLIVINGNYVISLSLEAQKY